MNKYNTLLTLHEMALKPLGGQPNGDYWLALQRSTLVTPINIKRGLELTPGQLFKAQKDTRPPRQRVKKAIYKVCVAGIDRQVNTGR